MFKSNFYLNFAFALRHESHRFWFQIDLIEKNVLIWNTRYPISSMKNKRSRKNSIGFCLKKIFQKRKFSNFDVFVCFYADRMNNFISFPIDNEKKFRFIFRNDKKKIFIDSWWKIQKINIGTKLISTKFNDEFSFLMIPNLNWNFRIDFFTWCDQRLTFVNV